MKNETLLQRLKREVDYKTADRTSLEAYKWLRTKINDISGTLGGSNFRKEFIRDQMEAGNALKGDPSDIHIGAMVCYAYDPKHKKTLPYYDTFPLGFLVNVTATGSWQMINLHYLPPKARAILFDKLMQITTNKNLNKKTKVRLSYTLLKSASKFNLFKPCFKEYLPSQVRSRIIKISPEDWATVMFLPLAQFKKAGQSKIWSDSLKKV